VPLPLLPAALEYFNARACMTPLRENEISIPLTSRHEHASTVSSPRTLFTASPRYLRLRHLLTHTASLRRDELRLSRISCHMILILPPHTIPASADASILASILRFDSPFPLIDIALGQLIALRRVLIFNAISRRHEADAFHFTSFRFDADSGFAHR